MFFWTGRGGLGQLGKSRRRMCEWRVRWLRRYASDTLWHAAVALSSLRLIKGPFLPSLTVSAPLPSENVFIPFLQTTARRETFARNVTLGRPSAHLLADSLTFLRLPLFATNAANYFHRKFALRDALGVGTSRNFFPSAEFSLKTFVKFVRNEPQFSVESVLIA